MPNIRHAQQELDVNQKTLDLAAFKAPEAPVVAKRRVKKEVLLGVGGCVRECRLERMKGRVFGCLCTRLRCQPLLRVV